ncbi:LysM repeat protein/uncharacterized protein YkwD [Weissella uvarum]|uniref:CAP domain-containing protein n=1 Tax=Weissella uvarum TaxID=1479233 RepID=UPI001960A1C0|nr:CAP domain-containing protein [Weissella uvarum]MBM7617119.1 LysM repeat protein/uncharacterized protein YkwD [Weissella uvarum]MCM0595415.1 LysM peptidoglycan-binding domain-containing protein [Weissella uvarum]
MENQQRLMKSVGKTSLLASTLFAAGIFVNQVDASADGTWQANSVATVKQQVNASNPAQYGVHNGDTLWALSQATNQSVATLAQRNGIQNPDLIYAGSTLNLSSHGVVTASQATQAAQTAQTAQVNQATAANTQAKQVAAQKVSEATVAKQQAQTAQAKANEAAQAKAVAEQKVAQAKQVQAKRDAQIQARSQAAVAANQQAVATQAKQTAESKARDAQVAQAKEAQTNQAQVQATQQQKQTTQSNTKATNTNQQADTQTNTAVTQTSDATFAALNQLRQINGLAPLTWDAGLAAKASARAAQINATQTVPADHFTGSGNEVIAIGWNAGTPVINAWYNETNMVGAPGHRNWEMNANYSKVGFAQVGNTIVGLAE